MRRLVHGLTLLAVAGCLQPGAPLYEKMDVEAPTLVSMTPPMIPSDGGVLTVQASDVFDLTFSEEMEPDSLRAGLSVQQTQTRQEQPLVIVADPVLRSAADYPSAYHVKISGPDGGFASGVYSLTLRSLLLDTQGNPLDPEQTGFFNVP